MVLLLMIFVSFKESEIGARSFFLEDTDFSLGVIDFDQPESLSQHDIHVRDVCVNSHQISLNV